MDRWKAEMGRGREKRRVEESTDQRRERLRVKKEDADARKGRKVAKHCVFQWFVAPEGRKVGSLKRRVQSHLARWEMKNCTPLWREAHFQVKMYKIHQDRSTFGSWDVEKVHAVEARSTFTSQNVQNTPAPDHFWKLRCRKSARSFGAKHILKSKVQKTDGRQMCFRVAGARDCAPCQNWAKREGFAAFPKAMARVGHLKRFFTNAFRVAGAVQKTCSSEMLGGQGADFLRGVAFWSIRSSGLLRWFCVTGAALHMTWHHFFVAGAILSTGGVEKLQNALVEAVSSALNFPFLKEVLQNCFVYDVVNFETWGSLADLFHFWCYQVQKLRKSRRLVSFLMLSTSKLEEVSQNCFIFDVAKFKNWGSLAGLFRFCRCQVQKLRKSRRIAAGRQTDRQTNR